MTQSSTSRKRFRIQGTDGIRREVRPSTDPALRGLTPQQAFLEHGVITDEFMERYAYAHVAQVLKGRRSKTRAAFVVAWDPRDMDGLYTEAVIRGVRKAGADAWVLGIAPTPLVPLYMQYAQADGGFMVTASHNPNDQNGIKIFLAWRGMKLLPENDIALTAALMKTPSVKSKPLKGKRIDRRDEAVDLFLRFSLDAENSWIEDATRLKDIIMVVDPARGALTGLAAEAFRRAGFGKVIEVNNRLDGNVNHNSGVADLEGHRVIEAEAIDPKTGAFAQHKAVCKLFELGRTHRQEIKNAKRRVAAAVFDADGDRFYRLDYHPFKDLLIVSSGDETAYLQAEYLMHRDPARYRNTAYIHTVESDLNTGLAAGKLGLQRQLAAVGDKWILLRCALLIVQTRLRRIPAAERSALKPKLDALKQSDRFDVARLAALEKEIDRVEKTSRGNIEEPVRIPLAVGSEETGHNITPGRLDTVDGRRIPVFCGNGLKSALNTFAATETLLRGKSPQRYAAHIEKPFTPGWKATLYAYYVRQAEFHNGSAVWNRVKRLIRDAARERGYTCKARRFREDPDMLYMALTSPRGTQAAVFVRNSGTENKIGFNLRGAKQDARALGAIGERVLKLLLQSMKDTDHHLYKVELDLLSRIAGRALIESQIKEPEEQRVLHEMGKQKLVQPSAQGLTLTALGKWYISH